MLPLFAVATCLVNVCTYFPNHLWATLFGGPSTRRCIVQESFFAKNISVPVLLALIKMGFNSGHKFLLAVQATGWDTHWFTRFLDGMTSVDKLMHSFSPQISKLVLISPIVTHSRPSRSLEIAQLCMRISIQKLLTRRLWDWTTCEWGDHQL